MARFWKRTPKPELDLQTALIQALVDTNAAILGEMSKISTAIVESTKVKAEPVVFSGTRFAMSEEEEDFEYLRASGQISAEEYTALMEQAGLQNTEIHFADDFYEHEEEQ